MPLWIAVFIDILGFSILIPFLPFFVEVFETNEFVVGLLLATNAMASFIFAPILGKLSDIYGRRPLLLISQIGTMIGFLMLAFSTTLEMLFFSRIVDGIFGGNFPIAKAIISDSVPPKDRPLQMTNVGLMHVLASLIGPGLGGILSFWGLIVPGLLAAGLSLFTIIITIFLLKETWPKDKRIKKLKEKLNIKIRNNPNAVYLLTQWGFHTVSFTIYVSTISLFASSVLGLDAFEIGILLMISGVFRAIIRFSIFKPILNKIGVDNMIKLGLILFLITFFLIGFVQTWWQAFIILLFISFAASCTRGPLSSKITQSVTPKEQGKINGYSSALDSFSQIIGPTFGGFILWAFEPYLLGISTSLLALVAFLMAFKKIDLLQDKQIENEISTN
jgi:DHA1 family tetracycline resistance protein-like MFS transporter